jgi:hypothetical protein
MRARSVFGVPVSAREVAAAVVQAVNVVSPRYKRFAACVRFYYPREGGDEVIDAYYFVKTADGGAVVAVDWNGRPVAAAQPNAVVAAVRAVFKYAEQKKGEKPVKVEVYEVPEEVAFPDWFE